MGSFKSYMCTFALITVLLVLNISIDVAVPSLKSSSFFYQNDIDNVVELVLECGLHVEDAVPEPNSDNSSCSNSGCEIIDALDVLDLFLHDDDVSLYDVVLLSESNDFHYIFNFKGYCREIIPPPPQSLT